MPAKARLLNKCENISKSMLQNNVDILTLQERHIKEIDIARIKLYLHSILLCYRLRGLWSVNIRTIMYSLKPNQQ